MTKQMISFTDPQIAFLRKDAKRLGISVAELVRRIIDAHVERAGLFDAMKDEIAASQDKIWRDLAAESAALHAAEKRPTKKR